VSAGRARFEIPQKYRDPLNTKKLLMEICIYLIVQNINFLELGLQEYKQIRKYTVRSCTYYNWFTNFYQKGIYL